MAANKKHDAKDETLLEAGLMMFAAFAVLFALVWFMASHKIVYFMTPILRWFAAPWYFFEGERWASINEAYVVFRTQPRSIPLSNFLAFANDCLRPLAVVEVLAAIGYMVKRFVFGKTTDLRRKLSPMQAALEISKVYPAIIPVLHLGPQLVANQLPLWRRQSFPEDVWQNEKVGGKPLAIGGRLFRDRVETYFRGGEVKDGPRQVRGGRRWSRSLGYLMVDLLVDVKKQDTICFPDRFSTHGKVLFALLCAHALGGREGKKDYQKACDQLNRSSAGQSNGLPNLTVAQWIFDKYRMHASAKKLFAVHHWEFTYLFSMFMKAKTSGKTTHTDFIWLKPLDRVLFYALNTVGRAVPHTEAAGVFAQYDYELKCARLGRLPLRVLPDGRMEMNIVMFTAVEGMSREFIRYQASTEDDEDWWMKVSTWTAAERYRSDMDALAKSVREFNSVHKQMAAVPVEPDTAFDVDMAEKRRIEEAAAIQKAVLGMSTAEQSVAPPAKPNSTSDAAAGRTGTGNKLLDDLF